MISFKEFVTERQLIEMSPNENILIEATPLLGVKSPNNIYHVKKIKEKDGTNVYQVHLNKKQVGFATLNNKNTAIQVVKVDQEHQRKGIATALHHHVEKDIGKKLKPASDYSEEGKKFWNAYKGIKEVRDWDIIRLEGLSEEDIKAYNEEMSTFTHDNKLYDLKKLNDIVKENPVKKFKVSDLVWIFKWDDPNEDHPERISTARLSVPILVTHWKNKLVVIDGLHRLKKAENLKMTEIEGKLVTQDQLQMVELISEVRDYAAEIKAQNERKEGEYKLKNTLDKHYSDLPHPNRLKEYGNSGAYLNNYLWNKHKGDKHVTPLYDKQASEMDEALHKHKTPQEMTVWSKSIHDPRELKNSEGIVHHPAFLSTSVHKHIPEQEFQHRNTVISKSGAKVNNIFKIKVPKDHPGAYISHVTGSRYSEFVLPRGTNMKHHSTSTIYDQGRNEYHYTHELSVI